MPLWLIEGDPPPRALGELVVQREDLLARYASWLRGLQPDLWQEVQAMAKTKEIINWEAVARTGEDVVEIVRYIPPEQVIEVMGLDKVIEAAGTDKVIKAVGPEKTLDALLAQVSQEQLQEMLKRRQQQGDPPPEGEVR